MSIAPISTNQGSEHGGVACEKGLSSPCQGLERPCFGEQLGPMYRIDLRTQVSIISRRVSNSCPHWTQRIQSESTVVSSSRIPIPPQGGHRVKWTF